MRVKVITNQTFTRHNLDVAVEDGPFVHFDDYRIATAVRVDRVSITRDVTPSGHEELLVRAEGYTRRADGSVGIQVRRGVFTSLDRMPSALRDIVQEAMNGVTG